MYNNDIIGWKDHNFITFAQDCPWNLDVIL